MKKPKEPVTTTPEDKHTRSNAKPHAKPHAESRENAPLPDAGDQGPRDPEAPRALSRRAFLQTGTASGLAAGAAASGLAGAACKDDAPSPRSRSGERSGSGEPSAARDPGAPRPGRDPRAPGREPPRARLPEPQPQPRKTGESTVVLVRDEAVLDDRGRVRAKVLARMMDDAVKALTGAPDPLAAWKRLFRPEDLLGIKTNVWKHLGTPPALEAHLKRQAQAAGIPADRILVDDRNALRTLAGCTALVNARPLRSHHWAGIGGCLKNYIMFVERPSEYHPDACADLGALWNLPVVKGKTRLCVLVMLTPLYHGRGPHHFSPSYLWPYKGLIVSADPVAADRVGLEILRAKRRAAFGEDRPMAVHPHHVELADTRHGVGVADWKRIKLIRLGWDQDTLLPS